MTNPQRTQQSQRAHLFILIGPSGVGKSTLLRYLEERADAESAPKYTTRPSRGTPEDARDFIFCEPDEFPQEGVLCFESYGHLFGIQLTKIEESLRYGRSHVTAVGDCATASRLMALFQERSVCIFVYCSLPVLRKRMLADRTSRRIERYHLVRRELTRIYTQLGCVQVVIDNSHEELNTFSQIDRLLTWLDTDAIPLRQGLGI